MRNLSSVMFCYHFKMHVDYSNSLCNILREKERAPLGEMVLLQALLPPVSSGNMHRLVSFGVPELSHQATWAEPIDRYANKTETSLCTLPSAPLVLPSGLASPAVS